MWTQFYDLSSGGTEKTDWSVIYIELPIEDAIEYFQDRFGLDPYNITCPCCGEDFSVQETDIEPMQTKRVLIIRKDEI